MSEDSLLEVLEAHGISPDYLPGTTVSRREFLAALGGGIAILILVPSAHGQPPGVRGPRGAGREAPTEIGGWLHIGEDGAVTAFVGKVELGQNARTSLTQVVAEELRLKPESVALVMGDTALTPFDMGTFGSRTTPYTVPPLRKAAAAARELLLDLAAVQMAVERSALAVMDGKVTHAPSGRTLGFGELTKGQDLVQPIPADTPTISPADWRVVGQRVRKLDGVSVVTGQKKYASDLKRPGMLQGKVLRPPAMKATLTSVDTSAAEAMAGVVVHREGDFVGVAAPSEQVAVAALAAIKAEWDRRPLVTPDALYDHLRRTATGAGRDADSVGSMEAGLAAADVKLQQTYTLAYIAHTVLEPRSAIAEWADGNLTVWTATQSPFGVRSSLAGIFGIPESRVRVIAPDTASGFGGKTPGQAAIEAARLAKVAGKPVRVAWTREEEMTWPHFRPAGVIEITSGAKRDGTLVAWEYHNYNSGPAALRTPYAVPNRVVQYHPCDSPLAQGAYRALAAPANFWAREMHMDELAQALRMDPLAFRLANLSDARLRVALQTAAERFGWGRLAPANGRGYGIACGLEKGGYVGTCAQVLVDKTNRQVRVERIVTAFECGAVINPLQLENQIEGATVMALGGALFEAIKFDEYRILNPTYSTYRVPRFSDTPRIEAVLIDRRDLPSAGGGETPFCAVAPAVGNAICNATGVRLRSLPMAPDGVPA